MPDLRQVAWHVQPSRVSRPDVTRWLRWWAARSLAAIEFRQSSGPGTSAKCTRVTMTNSAGTSRSRCPTATESPRPGTSMLTSARHASWRASIILGSSRSTTSAAQTTDSATVVSKFVQGADLKTRIATNRPSYAGAVRLVIRIAEGLHHAHQAGLVHRDIKPANLLVDAKETPYVADFGLVLKAEDFGKEPGILGRRGT